MARSSSAPVRFSLQARNETAAPEIAAWLLLWAVSCHPIYRDVGPTGHPRHPDLPVRVGPHPPAVGVEPNTPMARDGMDRMGMRGLHPVSSSVPIFTAISAPLRRIQRAVAATKREPDRPRGQLGSPHGPPESHQRRRCAPHPFVAPTFSASEFAFAPEGSCLVSGNRE